MNELPCVSKTSILILEPLPFEPPRVTRIVAHCYRTPWSQTCATTCLRCMNCTNPTYCMAMAIRPCPMRYTKNIRQPPAPLAGNLFSHQRPSVRGTMPIIRFVGTLRHQHYAKPFNKRPKTRTSPSMSDRIRCGTVSRVIY